MRRLKIFLQTFLLLLPTLVSFAQSSWALEKDTHKFLNKKIARDYSTLNSYLKEKLGFNKGIENTLVSLNQSKTVEEWIGFGGKAEDEPMYTRSFNHFHNPLKAWDKAGLKGISQSATIWAREQGDFGSLF